MKAIATATGHWGPPRETHRRREPETATATGYWGHRGKRTAAGSRRPQPQRAIGGHRGKRTAAGSRRPQPQQATGGHPGKRTAAGSRRPQPQRASGGHPGKRTAAGSRRPQPQRASGGHPGKRTAAGSRRLSPNGFYLKDRNPLRQSLIREKEITSLDQPRGECPSCRVRTAVSPSRVMRRRVGCSPATQRERANVSAPRAWPQTITTTSPSMLARQRSRIARDARTVPEPEPKPWSQKSVLRYSCVCQLLSECGQNACGKDVGRERDTLESE